MNLATRLVLLVSATWCGLYELRALGLGFIPVGDVKTVHLLSWPWAPRCAWSAPCASARSAPPGR